MPLLSLCLWFCIVGSPWVLGLLITGCLCLRPVCPGSRCVMRPANATRVCRSSSGYERTPSSLSRTVRLGKKHALSRVITMLRRRRGGHTRRMSTVAQLSHARVRCLCSQTDMPPLSVDHSDGVSGRSEKLVEESVTRTPPRRCLTDVDSRSQGPSEFVATVNSPSTRSCMRSVLEKQVMRQTSRLMRVRIASRALPPGRPGSVLEGRQPHRRPTAPSVRRGACHQCLLRARRGR
jgi:hypothetical protein